MLCGERLPRHLGPDPGSKPSPLDRVFSSVTNPLDGDEQISGNKVLEVDLVTPAGWSGSSESLAAHVCGQEGLITMTTRKRHTPEQVVRKLTQADRLLAEGKDVADVCRELQVSEQTYYRWRNQFGGLKADDAKRLKDLERENATLKRLLADAELEKAALKEIASGKLLSPARRRAAVHHLIARDGCE